MAQPQHKNTGFAKSVQPFVVGGSAAMFASACVSPMDVSKTRLQVMVQGLPKGSPKPSLVAVMKDILAKEGAVGLYAGLSASLMRQAVYGTARLGLHREFSDRLKAAQGGGALPAWKSVASSMASGAIASVIGTPFDISLVRMQADSLKPPAERRGYKNVFDALSRIAREEGVASLWRGFEPTVARAIAMNVGMMATYDVSRDAIRKVNGDGFSTQLAASATAAIACVTTSLPFDMIKTRLQNMKADAAGVMPYRGVVDCATKIVSNEGALALWTGFGAYYGRTAPHAMIILISMDALNKAYSKALNT